MPDQEWYYADNGESRGPFGENDFRVLVRDSKVGPETPVWTEGMAEWKPLKESAFKAAGPLLPPASSEPKAKCDYCGLEFAVSKLAQEGSAKICGGCKAKLARISPRGATQAQDFEYAGFLPRFGALILDGILLLMIQALLSSACSMLTPNPRAGAGRLLAFVMMMLFRILIGGLVGVGYHTYFVAAMEGTLGKQLMGLRVIRADGSRISYPRAFGRYWAFFFGVASLALGLLIFISFFDLPMFISLFLVWVLVLLYFPIRKNIDFFGDFECRTLHDRLCDTRVVLRAR